MKTSDLLRYSCQLALPGFTEVTQQLLQQAKVLIVGAGGLGCPAAQYLAATGTGTLGIADFDTVSIGNLHRQVLFTPAEVGMNKAIVACDKLQKQNPGIRLVPHAFKVTTENIVELLEQYDLVLDGTDNFDTKYLLNDACVMAGKPLVFGAIYQYEGQVAVWNFSNSDGSRSPNYRDVFPGVDASQVPNCTEGGVIPTLAGMIGCMQANEAIKLITGTGELLAGKLLLFDALTMQSRIIKIGNVSKVSITSLPEIEEVPLISVSDLKAGLDDDLYELIDVRSEAERAAFHIGGQHLPIDQLKQLNASNAFSKPVVFYCASGKRSGEAVKQAGKLYSSTTFYSLDGGMKAWREQTC